MVKNQKPQIVRDTKLSKLGLREQTELLELDKNRAMVQIDLGAMNLCFPGKITHKQCKRTVELYTIVLGHEVSLCNVNCGCQCHLS